MLAKPCPSILVREISPKSHLPKLQSHPKNYLRQPFIPIRKQLGNPRLEPTPKTNPRIRTPGKHPQSRNRPSETR